jgi:hypothetical protein
MTYSHPPHHDSKAVHHHTTSTNDVGEAEALFHNEYPCSHPRSDSRPPTTTIQYAVPDSHCAFSYHRTRRVVQRLLSQRRVRTSAIQSSPASSGRHAGPSGVVRGCRAFLSVTILAGTSTDRQGVSSKAVDEVSYGWYRHGYEIT